jgi:hypothetical protein
MTDMMKPYNHGASSMTKVAHVMDEVYNVPTDTKVAQLPVSEEVNSLTSF